MLNKKKKEKKKNIKALNLLRRSCVDDFKKLNREDLSRDIEEWWYTRKTVLEKRKRRGRNGRTVDDRALRENQKKKRKRNIVTNNQRIKKKSANIINYCIKERSGILHNCIFILFFFLPTVSSTGGRLTDFFSSVF